MVLAVTFRPSTAPTGFTREAIAISHARNALLYMLHMRCTLRIMRDEIGRRRTHRCGRENEVGRG